MWEALPPAVIFAIVCLDGESRARRWSGGGVRSLAFAHAILPPVIGWRLPNRIASETPF